MIKRGFCVGGDIWDPKCVAVGRIRQQFSPERCLRGKETNVIQAVAVPIHTYVQPRIQYLWEVSGNGEGKY